MGLKGRDGRGFVECTVVESTEQRGNLSSNARVAAQKSRVKTVSHVVSVSRLSTSEFHSAVYSLSPSVAVFDCDGTLWSGDAGVGFMKWTIETGLVSREATDWIDSRYRGYMKGEVS